MAGADRHAAGRLRLAPGLRLRPVPELGFCIAFTPGAPRLHRLNATAWLVLELAPGRTPAALVDAFLTAAAGRVESARAAWCVADATAMLRGAGIIEIEHGEDRR